ncbi:hypothetical protein ACLOJK_023001 [Asimina triloba]
MEAGICWLVGGRRWKMERVTVAGFLAGAMSSSDGRLVGGPHDGRDALGRRSVLDRRAKMGFSWDLGKMEDGGRMLFGSTVGCWICHRIYDGELGLETIWHGSVGLLSGGEMGAL